VSIFFDQNEPFIRHLKPVWQAGKADLRRSKGNGWPLQIRSVEPASGKVHTILQAVDLLSWVIRCRYEYGDKLIDPKVVLLMFPFMAAAGVQGGFMDAASIQVFYVERRSLSVRHNYSFV
jgi:hypothetical protein